VQALEVVRLKRRGDDAGATAAAEGAAATGAAGRTARAAAEAEDDSLEGFLMAGHSLKAGEDIDLGEEEGEAGGHDSQAPAALLALEDQGHSVGDGDATCYRLTQCCVHSSGALLLDAVDGDLYDACLGSIIAHRGMLVVKGAAAAAQRVAGGEEDEDDAGVLMGDDDEEEQAEVGQQHQQQQAVQAGGTQPDGQPAQEVGAAVPAATQAQTQAALPAAAPLAAPSQHKDAGQQEITSEAQPYDPYAPLSMHSKGNLPIRPMVVRRPAKDKINPAVVAARRMNSGKQPTLVTGLINSEFMYALHLAASAQGPAGGQRAAAKARAAAAVDRNQEQLRPVFEQAVDAAPEALQQELLLGDEQEEYADPVVGYDDDDDRSLVVGEWDNAGLGAGPGGDASTADDLLGKVACLASRPAVLMHCCVCPGPMLCQWVACSDLRTCVGLSCLQGW
jgi:hypothetical protein